MVDETSSFNASNGDTRVSRADAVRGPRGFRVLATSRDPDERHLRTTPEFQWCARGLALPIRNDSNCGETDPDTYNLKRGHNLTEDFDGGDRGHERAQVAITDEMEAST